MDIHEQIESGKLVCPKTKKPLKLSADREWLTTDDETERYRLINRRVPVLLIDEAWADQHISASERMIKEYDAKTRDKKPSLVACLKAKMVQDYRNPACRIAFQSIFDSQSADALYLSVGGGPTRPHPKLVNLNLGLFPNVEVVADAHHLPYADNSVDAIFCEAVLEHLHDPVQAIQEMFRVIKPGGKVFAATPFLQAYHGYPHHYQNFTLTGHQNIFKMRGFEIVEAGTCVGPIYTLVSLISTLIHEFSPRILKLPLRVTWGLLGAVLRPIDKLINHKPNAHILASTTYLVAQKNPQDVVHDNGQSE